MDNPERIIDKHDRIWSYDKWLEEYKCISVPSLYNQSLTELQDKCGPMHVLTKGPEVEPSFKPFDNGQWVQFDAEDLFSPGYVPGRVLSYNEEKLYYQIIVNVLRDDVKEL